MDVLFIIKWQIFTAKMKQSNLGPPLIFLWSFVTLLRLQE
jgi:hypothetical protein